MSPRSFIRSVFCLQGGEQFDTLAVLQRILSGHNRFLTLLLLAATLGTVHFAPRAAAEPLPGASAVTRRMIERAQAVARGGLGGP